MEQEDCLEFEASLGYRSQCGLHCEFYLKNQNEKGEAWAKYDICLTLGEQEGLEAAGNMA